MRMSRFFIGHLVARVILLLCLLFVMLQVSASGGNIEKRPFYFQAIVGDLVWFDIDNDGIHDAAEPGFEGIVVLLQDAAGTVVSTDTTDYLGNYAFTEIETGTTGKTYQLVFKLPPGYRFSVKNGLLNDTNNSDADPVSGKTGLFPLLPGQVNMHVDAGLVTPANSTLPLHRLELTGVLKGTAVFLNWVAENEMNTKGFIIQQSVDGVNYTDIGSKGMEGPVNTPTLYKFTTDINAFAGYPILYYRIKAEDNNQHHAYSNVVPVRFNRLTDITVWPNPFVNEVRLSFNAVVNTTLHISLVNTTGSLLWSANLEVSRGQNQLPLAGIEKVTAGVYFIRIVDVKSGDSFTQQLTK